MKKIAHYYFAYGANMNKTQMKERCSNPQILGIGCLPGYRVGFYGDSAIWDGGQETLVPDVSSETWGVLYQLSFFDCEQLDLYQDVRFDGTGPYFHYPVDVVDQEGRIFDALIYKKDKLGEEMPPSQEYLDFIIQGAREQGLPEEYIGLLQNRITKPASYVVPLVRKSKYSYMNIHCGDCGD